MYYVVEVATQSCWVDGPLHWAIAEQWRDTLQAKALAEGLDLHERRFAVRHESLFREGQ